MGLVSDISRTAGLNIDGWAQYVERLADRFVRANVRPSV
jgi:hypothetical protein